MNRPPPTSPLFPYPTLSRSIARRTGVRDGGRVHGGPVRIARRAGLVAAPAHVGASVREHDCPRLEPPHEPKDARPIVHLATPVGPFPVGAVEPHLGDGPVTREQFGELVAIEVVVARRVAVERRVAIPRRHVETGA